MVWHPASQKVRLWGVSAAAVLLLPAFVAWTDHVASEGSVVAANVVYEDVDLSGRSVAAAAAEVESRVSQLLRTPITIETDGGTITAPARELGFSYDHDGVISEIARSRHTGGPLGVFASWVASPFSTVSVEDSVTFDPQVARIALESRPGLVVDPIQEPGLSMEGTNYFYPTQGSTGTVVDIEALVADLSSLEIASGPQLVVAPTESVPPSVTDRYVDEVADRLNSLTSAGMDVRVGTRAATLTTAQVRRHLRTSVTSGAVHFEFDSEGLLQELEAAIPGPVGVYEPPTFEFVDGDIVVAVPGEVPPVCCDIASVRQAAEGMLAGGTGPWLLDPKPSDSELEAWADGSLITDKVAEFTTSHSCCQPRVTNIHRMADLVKGAYLVPGQQMSLNRRVPRTRANGFVSDGAIRFGQLTDEVGGGVSQFATTLFNAAYFAGLDFAEYKSHSIYFKRYPFGREATVSSPKPDLVLVNTTDHPVLVWATYDSRNITVTMYSTDHVEVVELGQRVSPQGQCTFVETDRQRSYPDGRVVVDTIEATYRPEEGFDCNGLRIVIPQPENEETGDDPGTEETDTEPGE